MVFELGVLFALGALLCWGFGDFLIQRSTKKFGVWEPLFIITAIGVVMLFPFVASNLAALLAGEGPLLLLAGIIMLGAGLLQFKAFEEGKMAVVEPILALEVPVTAVLAGLVVGEAVQPFQAVLIFLLVSGLIILSIKPHHLSRKAWLERGALLAVGGAFFVGTANFLVGFASRLTDPLLTSWVVTTFLAVVSFAYLLSTKKIIPMLTHLKSQKKLLVSVSIIDNLAWVFYAVSTLFIPMAVAIALSESYIALAVLLGLIINKERILEHQKLGLGLAIASALFLAITL